MTRELNGGRTLARIGKIRRNQNALNKEAEEGVRVRRIERQVSGKEVVELCQMPGGGGDSKLTVWRGAWPA